MKFTWGHAIIIFFAIFLTWIISFVIFSLGENNDLVVKDYYRQGAEYSKQMKIDQRSSLYKDSIVINNVSEGVQIQMAPSIAQNTSEKTVYFYRPSGAKNDIIQKIRDGEKSAIVAKNKLLAGRYKVSVAWIINEQKYLIVKDFMVK